MSVDKGSFHSSSHHSQPLRVRRRRASRPADRLRRGQLRPRDWPGGQVGRRPVRPHLGHYPVGVDQHLLDLQPELRREHDAAVHAAVAARLPDRSAAHATGRLAHQPGHLRHRPRADRRQHARRRELGVLGSRLRARRRGRAAAGAGAGRAARGGQPSASRGGHDGADRRRGGAVRGCGATPVAGAGRRDAAHLRAGPEGAHRGGHVR